MKQIYAPLLILCVLFSACKKALKDFDDYFPSFFVTATELPDGSVQVTATITKNGAISIEGIGFAYAETENFPINENQVIADKIVNNTFTVTYPPGFDISKTYYFKAWITNELGYKASEVVSLSNIEADPVNGPCNNPLDYLFVYQMSEAIINTSEWQQDVDFNQYFTLTGSYSNIRFTFDQIPNTGIYTTTSDTPNTGQVKISFSNTLSSFFQSSLDPGQFIYVNKTSPTSWNIEICSASYQYNSTNFEMSTHFNK